MTAAGEDIVRVLCVDDNALIIDALTVRFALEPWIQVAGVLPQADGLVETALETKADIVLLDVDMPGRDAFDALAELSSLCPDVRAIMVSGHVRGELLDRALESGAWGYISKTAGADAVVSAIRSVRDGEFVFSPDVPAEGFR